MLEINLHPFPVLTTERLTLRRITDDDAADMLAQRSNPETMRYIDRPLAVSIDDALKLIEKIKDSFAANEGITWGISLKNERAMIGTIGYWRVIPERHRAEIGYLIDPAHQGKGLMQEALTAVLEYGFHTMDLHTVEADVNPGNEISIRMLEKNGFVKEAYFKDYHYHDGKFLDTVIYTLFAPEK